MELDGRIIEGKTYLDCFHTEAAKKFIGKECYLSDGVASFANVDTLRKGTLVSIDDGAWCPYKVEGDSWNYSSTFILPCEWVKTGKKYRPYKDVEEFFSDTGCTLGDVIRFRKKDTTEEEYHTLLTGFKGNARVNIGLGDGGYYSLSDLFSLFELYTSDGWRPFGVLDE